MANPYFNATYYLTNNPDVFAAGINTVEGAWEHYVNHGAAESLAGATSRKPAPWFDASYYLTNNPDLSTAGLTAGQLFEHFTVHGISEGRAPSAGAALTEESLLKYALANEDLLEAFDIADDATELTDAQALALASQFYSHGYMESRPDAPFEASVDPDNAGATFTLTTGNDFADVAGSFRNGSTTPFDFKFTSDNEVVNATTATMGNAGTNNDSLADGSTTDADVLNVSVTGNTTMATIRNIENINFNVVAGTAASTVANLAGVTGLKTITLSGSPAGAVDLTNGNTYTSIGATGVTTIDASKMTTGGITVSSAGATTTAALTITGSDAADTITGGLGADIINGGAGADTLAGGAGADEISGGAGNDVISGGNDSDILKGDAGNDNIDGGLGADVIEGGAGNDLISTGGGNDKVTGGAGNDSIVLGTFVNNGAGAAGGAAGGVVAATNAATFTAANSVAAGNNTVIFGASLADNGVDVITAFDTATTANSAAGGPVAQAGSDVLDFSAFLGKAVTNYVEIGATDGPNNVTGSNVVVVTDGTLAAALGAGEGITFGANAKTVVLAVNATTNTTADAVYITTDSNGAILTQDVVVTLVGVTATANDISGFGAANFA